MISKFVILAVLASLAAVAHGASFQTQSNTNIVPLEREEKIFLEIPSIGSLILKSFNVAWFLIKSAFSLIGWKLAALACASNAVFWLFGKSFSVLLGATAMFGFCKLTDKCSLNYVPQELVEVGETLVWAARSLEEGVTKYGLDNRHR